MILVDVIVPAAGQQYDFELEESVSIEVLIREMLETVCQKEHRDFHPEDGKSICLYSKEKEKLLPSNRTLHQCGIRSGEALILL